MTTFRIGPSPPQDLPSPRQSLQTGTHLALQPAIQAVQPAANAQPALQPVTQPLQQATAQPTLQPITQILQQPTAQPALRAITPVLQQTTTQTDFQPVTETFQPVTQVLQPVISEQSTEPTTTDFSQQVKQIADQEPQVVEDANMTNMQEQMYQIQGADGNQMIVSASQLQQLQQPQYVQQNPQVAVLPSSRPTSVYYTQGALPGQQVIMSNGQIVQPVVAPAGTTMVAAPTTTAATTTAHGVPVVNQVQKEDDLLSFYDPSWYKKQTTAGSLGGSTLAWLVFALILLVLVLHVIAFGMPYWSWYKLSAIDISAGLWQVCDNILGCRTPEYRLNTALLDHLKASQALAGIILVGLVILTVIFLVFMANSTYKKYLEILTIVVSFITAILMLTLLSLWEVNVRRTLAESWLGASYILEIITFIFTLFIPVIATVDYMLLTRKA